MSKSNGQNTQNASTKCDKKIKTEKLDSDTKEGSNLDSEDQEVENLNSGKRKHEILPLLVSNFPDNYGLVKMTDFLVKKCGPCEVSLSDTGDKNVVEAIFGSAALREKAKKILSSQSIDKAHIRVESPVIQVYDSDLEENEEPQAKRKKEGDEKPWGLDMDVWRPDPKGYYGARPEYLTSLGIEGSLQNWVLVKNFRCSKEDLKEVLALAGEVVVCVVTFASPNSYARVMYKHPLEALQAVSMLNNQKFHGVPLIVRIIKTSCNGVLPKGLNSIGPGLAKNGTPLRDVIRHYERFVKGQETELNSSLFRTPKEQCLHDEGTYSKKEDYKRKAKEALETLATLVAQGMQVDDLMTVLKSIKGNQGFNSIIESLKEIDTKPSTPDSQTSKKDDKPSSSLEKKTNKQPSPVSSSGSGSRSPSPGAKNTKKPAETAKKSQQISTITNRSTNAVRAPAPKPSPIQPWAKPAQPPAPGTSTFKGGQNMPGTRGPPVRLPGPMFNVGRPGPMGPMSGPMPGPIGPMMGPMSGPMPGPMSGPMPGPMSGQMPGPMSGPMIGPNFSMSGPTQNSFGPNGPMGSIGPSTGTEAKLQFSNLPPSTTFALLSEKLSQVGQLLSIQFTTPGCVVAIFAHREHAERCRLQFDKSRLEGNLIDVRFI